MKFKNEPLTDFSNPENRRGMEQALDHVRRQFGKIYPLIINGEPAKSRRSIESINPSHPAEVVGIVQNADRPQVDRALAAATQAFTSWSRKSVNERAQLLRRAAADLRRRKFEFNAWLVFEVGKNWIEADADTAEAIDFLEYYAELATLPAPEPTPVPGERNEYRYLPLGPVVVIPPWNFPLAILVGMTMAAVVTGNTVVLKPSSQSPVIAAKFLELVMEAGLPAGVINLVTGAGGSIGDLLVKDRRTRMVAFTGSKAVGLHINALAGQTAPGQIWIKRVIAEMGGKNAIVVDASADLDQAAQGVLASAFGYQGQKCSACSRAYIHADVYEDFVEALLTRARDIRQGPADVFENFMGPVISASAAKTIEGYIKLGIREGEALLPAPHVKKKGPAKTGFFVPPAIFDDLPENSKLIKEEIFGPVLALKSVKSFEEGLAQANDSIYGLTGAVYSAEASHLEKAKDEFFCGNLYLNRKCTGAWVGGHPFGGFNMSGTDSKAGGPDYLQLFRQGKAIAQKESA